MGKLIWRTFSIEATGKWYTEDSYKELEQKLYDSEADWLKMRDIAEETQRKLVQLATMIVCNEQYEFSETYDVAKDFLAKINNNQLNDTK